MKKTIILKQIASITAGYTFRKALSRHDEGDVFVLQAKNILNDTAVDETNLDKISFKNIRTVANVHKDDVVISSRGNFHAGVIKTNLKNTIAASSIFILRINSPDILPDYLAFYINSAVGQKIIRDKTTGVVINTILKKDLENIIVTIPSLEIQKKIINLYQNNKQLEKILDKKKFLINKITEDIINMQ